MNGFRHLTPELAICYHKTKKLSRIKSRGFFIQGRDRYWGNHDKNFQTEEAASAEDVVPITA
jgi:hypothetical protein